MLQTYIHTQEYIFILTYIFLYKMMLHMSAYMHIQIYFICCIRRYTTIVSADTFKQKLLQQSLASFLLFLCKNIIFIDSLYSKNYLRISKDSLSSPMNRKQDLSLIFTWLPRLYCQLMWQENILSQLNVLQSL